ncbi:MAG: site-specific integrase [Candidatus Zixiibacteriota bacterium]|nr:MAG: site-specific integrase [candidate division Zixibacteria bacterium]
MPSYFVDYYDPKTNKRVRRSVGYDKKKAELRKSEIEWKLFRGEPGDVPQALREADFQMFFERYLDHCIKSRSLQSVRKDNGRHQTVRTFFLEEKAISSLNEITPGVVQELQAEYLADHSRKSWNSLLGILKTMLNRAVEWGVIDVNPISSIKPLKLDRKFHYFEGSEVKMILEAAEETLKTAIMILLHTGIRRSELWNLRWRDVNLTTRVITVKSHTEFSTKSRKIRSIPITGDLYKHLISLEKESAYVCRPYEHIHTLRKNFVKLLVRLGLQGTLHDLRHTFASHLTMSGVPIPVISELLGHSDIKTTMIYAHLSPGIHRAEIEKLKFK